MLVMLANGETVPKSEVAPFGHVTGDDTTGGVDDLAGVVGRHG